MNPFPHQLILGHRGSPREFTENTLRSFAHALDVGADGVELDIQRSREGVPVVIHDPTLQRTTKARGDVARLDWGAIARLTNAQVPSFDEVAAWASASGAWLNVEIKAPETEAAVVQAIHRTGIADRTFISSFHPSVVHRVGTIDPGLKRFFLAERWDADTKRNLVESTGQGLCLSRTAMSSEVITELRELAIPVVVWTVNDPLQIRAFLLAGVAGVITDVPDLAARERDSLEAG